MNKSLFISLYAVLFCLAGLVSCQKVGTETDAADGRVPVLFKTNVVATNPTKGNGSVVEWNSSQTLYIYGIERNEDGSFGTVLIDNVAVAAPMSGPEGSLEVYDPAHAPEQIPFFYDYTANYDFFGYFVDDAFVPGEETPVNDGSSICLPLKINGTQDILLGYADRESAATADIPAGRLYSAYAVRRGEIQPRLQFEHMLSRLVFNVIAGSTGVDPLYLTSLSVSSKTEGTLTIAGENRGLVSSGTASMLPLTNAGSPLEPYLVSGTHAVGESIMVMPGDQTYGLTFELEQNGIHVSQNQEISIPGGAEKGKSYTVNLTVYNLETIQLDITLTSWDGGDDIFIGEDDEEQSSDPASGHPKAVDLGLSVKWASCNVGASAPEEFGYYLAWGETEPKSTYTWNTYKWGSLTEDTLFKYDYEGLSRLEPEDDAATVNWGAGWRTPTWAEINELRNNCTWLWTTQNNVVGALVTGPSGHSIFLPASGCTSSLSLDGPIGVGYEGHIWASDMYLSYAANAYDISYYPSGSTGVYKTDQTGLRCNGQSVRPVKE